MSRASRVDHIVLVANDVPQTVRFYAQVLEGDVHQLAEYENGTAPYPSVLFGDWKANIHPMVTDAQPRARDPRPGTADVCLRFEGAVDDAIHHLETHGVRIELGPIAQECAGGWASSVYFRDPDGCLLEFACFPMELT